jgi:hypothetical protein
VGKSLLKIQQELLKRLANQKDSLNRSLFSLRTVVGQKVAVSPRRIHLHTRGWEGEEWSRRIGKRKGIRRADRNETAQIQKTRLSFVEEHIPRMGICQSESIDMGELVDIQDELSGNEEHRWTPCSGGDSLNVLMFDD